MLRLINADILINELEGILSSYTSNGRYPIGFGIEDAIDIVSDSVTVELVSCDECIAHDCCAAEDAFRIARIKSPFCCMGKRDKR